MITLKDTFWFGKHKGEVIEDILYDESSYIKWCIESVENFELSDEEIDIVMNVYYELSDDLDEYDGSYELRFDR